MFAGGSGYRSDADALDAVKSVLPAGTLSGAPKIRACEIIDELESEPRGIYGGALGYLDFSGNLDTCIAIRMAVKKKTEKSMYRQEAVSSRTAGRDWSTKSPAIKQGQ